MVHGECVDANRGGAEQGAESEVGAGRGDGARMSVTHRVRTGGRLTKWASDGYNFPDVAVQQL